MEPMTTLPAFSEYKPIWCSCAKRHVWHSCAKRPMGLCSKNSGNLLYLGYNSKIAYRLQILFCVSGFFSLLVSGFVQENLPHQAVKHVFQSSKKY